MDTVSVLSCHLQKCKLMDAGNACAAINPCRACNGLLHFTGVRNRNMQNESRTCKIARCMSAWQQQLMDARNACAAINPCQACSGLLHFSGLLININW